MNSLDRPESSPSLSALTAAQSVTFTARTWIARIDDEGRPLGGLMPGQAFAVQVRRPGSLRIEEVREDAVIEEAIKRAGCFAGNPFGVFISDGDRQIEVCKTSAVFIEDTAASLLEEIDSKRGLPGTLNIDVLFADEPLADFEPMGEDLVEGAPITVYVDDRTEDADGIQYRLYIDKVSGLPVRMSDFEPGESDAWVEAIRVDYSAWEFGVDLPDSTFDTTPPADAKPAPAPRPWFDQNLRPGMEPTSLNTVDLQGRAIELSDYNGRAVLLDYWATWCQPCLIAMVNLKSLYEQYHRQGLEIIGISLDREEQRERMHKYLNGKAIPWRQICDGRGFESSLATAYQVGAIPFLLLIDRAGRIAAVNPHGDELERAIQTALEQ